MLKYFSSFKVRRFHLNALALFAVAGVLVAAFNNASTLTPCDVLITGNGINTTNQKVGIAQVVASGSSIYFLAYDNSKNWSSTSLPTKIEGQINFKNMTVSGSWGAISLFPGEIKFVGVDSANQDLIIKGKKYLSPNSAISVESKIHFSGAAKIEAGGLNLDNSTTSVNNFFSPFTDNLFIGNYNSPVASSGANGDPTLFTNTISFVCGPVQPVPNPENVLPIILSIINDD